MLLKFRLPEDPGRGPLCCIPLGFWSKSVEFYRLRNFEFKAWGPHFCTSGLPNLHAGILLRPFWGHLSSSLSKTDFGTNSSPFSSQSAFRVRFGTWVGVRFWISFWGPFSDQGWINSAHLGRLFWDRAPILVHFSILMNTLSFFDLSTKARVFFMFDREKNGTDSFFRLLEKKHEKIHSKSRKKLCVQFLPREFFRLIDAFIEKLEKTQLNCSRCPTRDPHQKTWKFYPSENQFFKTQLLHEKVSFGFRSSRDPFGGHRKGPQEYPNDNLVDKWLEFSRWERRFIEKPQGCKKKLS